MLGILPDNKKLASLVIADKDGGLKKTSETMTDTDVAKKSAGQALIDAVHAKDAMAVFEAYQNLQDIADMGDDASESDEA